MNAVRAARRTRRQLRALMFLAFALGSIGVACRREAPPPPVAGPGPVAEVASTPASAAIDPPRAATTVPLASPGEASTSGPADGLLVPAAALYTQNEQQGVVRINQDGTQVFIPVDILSRQGDKVFISPIQTGILGKGQTVRLFR